MEHVATEERSLKALMTTFLADLAQAQFCVFHQGPVQTISAEALHAFQRRYASLRPATRARKQDLLVANLMRKIDRIKLDPLPPRGVMRDKIERILKVIPSAYLRDPLFFYSLLETGL